MTIQGLSYLVFVVVLWLIVWPIRNPRIRQPLFLIASYVFYASWGVDFLLILLISSLFNYCWGNVLRSEPTLKRLGMGIGFNVLLLVVFKYLPSASASIPPAVPFNNLLKDIVMPIGISFWTFQALSYLFDIYSGEDEKPSLFEFCLYLAFWPTVLSGPVTRIAEILPQFREMTKVDWEDIASGVHRILVGLFMKLVLAQVLSAGLQHGEGVSDGFDTIANWGGLDVWLLAVGFGFQLFFDFGGYTNIVIGTARLFGIRLPENFNRPYLSTTPSVFWNRWHMSLSFWIRDYVFLPLAAQRRNPAWRYFTLVVAMTLFGLWHGATLTFIIWGTYQGMLLVGHRIIQQWRRRRSVPWPAYAETFLSWGLTFALVSLGWVFFRANNLAQALTMLSAVISPGSYRHLVLRPDFYIVTPLVIACYFLYLGAAWLLDRWQNSVFLERAVSVFTPIYYAVLIFLIVVWSNQQTVFIYLQF